MTAKAVRKAEALYSLFRQGLEITNIDYVIQQAGIEIVPWRFPDQIRGCLMYEGENAFMGINMNHIEKYQNLARFTKAHELGHFKLHEKRQYFCMDDILTGNTSSLNRQLEWEANAFAAELLMPAFIVRRIHKQLNINELSNYFQVSREAMNYRLKNLGLI